MHIMMSRRSRLAATLLALAPAMAFAQNPLPGGDFPTDGRGYELWRRGNLVGIPAAGAGPTIGFAVGGALVNRFQTDSGSPHSDVGIGAFISTNASWGVGAGAATHFDNDTWRPAAGYAYYDLHYDFFGVGNSAGDRDQSIPVIQKGSAAIVQALYRVQRPIYFGARYYWARYDFDPDHQNDDPSLVALVNSNASYRVSSFGATANLDTRDNQDHPRHGAQMDAYAMFSGRGLGATRNFQQYNGWVSGYIALPKDQVLALRLRGCGVSTQTPIPELCLFGITPDLRGYTGGQYRDDAMIATQAEWRVPIDAGFGGVVFAGIGSVANEWGNLFKIGLPSLGVGARYRVPFLGNGGTTLGVDYAFGRSSDAFYFRVGEAF